MNVVTLIGNLTSDVELRELGEERKLATFRLAVDRPTSAGGADFVPVTVWGNQAVNCARYLTKGSLVGVEGRLRSRSWDDSEGKRHSALEVVATHVQFLPSRNGASGQPTPFEAGSAAEAVAERSMA